jgi:hypothetical protein
VSRACLAALAALSIVLACIATAPARAQAAADCHCDCYFGSDCTSGNFCDWGDLLREDNCWWRTPKPNGVPGNGCEIDYGSWGKCDGKCSPLPAAAGSITGGESAATLATGVSLWLQAFTDTAMAGGGRVGAKRIAQIESIGFENPATIYSLWRLAAEVMILSRGEASLVFPQGGGWYPWEVEVADLGGRPDLVRNGNVAAGVLAGEIARRGGGAKLVHKIDAAVLDANLYDRICPGGDQIACLYARLSDMGEILGRNGGAQEGAARASSGEEGEVTPPCPGCLGDIAYDDAVDFQDLLRLLGDWGSTTMPPADLNQDGSVDFTDLLLCLALWGPCGAGT